MVKGGIIMDVIIVEEVRVVENVGVSLVMGNLICKIVRVFFFLVVFSFELKRLVLIFSF